MPTTNNCFDSNHPANQDHQINICLDRLNALFNQVLDLHPQYHDPDHDIEGCATCETLLSTQLTLTIHGHHK